METNMNGLKQHRSLFISAALKETTTDNFDRLTDIMNISRL